MMSGSAKITSGSAAPSWSATRACARSHGVAAPSGSSARNHCGAESSPKPPTVPWGVSYKGSRFTRDSAARRAFDGRSLTRTRLVSAEACLSFGTGVLLVLESFQQVYRSDGVCGKTGTARTLGTAGTKARPELPFGILLTQLEGPDMRTSLAATFCLTLLLAGHAFAQDARQTSRQESFERDGIIWGRAAAWGVPFQS